MMNAEPTIHKFYNQDEACLFLSRMRAEGHRAYLLDQGTGWLWGPIAVGGIRVAVYELTEEEQEIEVPPATKPLRNIFPEWVGMLALAFVATAIAALVILVLRAAESGDFPVAGIVTFILLYLVSPAALALLLMPAILYGVKSLRSPESPLGMFLRLLVWIYIILWFAMLAFQLVLVVSDLISPGDPDSGSLMPL